MLHIFFITTIIRPTFVPSNLIEIMKKKNAHWLFISIIVLGFTSCLDEDYFQEQFEKRYNKQWENIFGKMDPNHDWNIIQQVNATVQVSEAGEHTLRIYTDHPKNKQSRLVAQIPVEGTGTIRFDLEKISKDVYARVKDAQGKVTFEGYFAVNGGEVLIDEGNIVSRLASRDATSGTSLFNATIINLPTAYRDGLNEYKELYGEYKNNNSNPVYLGRIHYFNNENTFINSNDFTWTKFKEDIIPIVNYDTYFGESNRSNRDKSAAGVEYVTIKEGPVELSYVYGATGLRNSFGYFYWTGNIDFSSDEGKNKFSNIPKIILMNDASPQSNLRLAEEESTSWDNALKLSDIQNEALGTSLKLLNYVYNSTHNQNPPEAPNYVIGSKYSLVYYGDNYDEIGTYIFPKDVHIGFFLYTSYWDYNKNGMAYSMPNPLETNDNILKTIVYSIPQLNYNIKEYYDYRYEDTKTDINRGNSSRGEISAVTFQFHGQKLLGFEDGVDKDMNDIMLLVDADVEVKDNNSAFKEQDKEYVDPNPTPEEPEEPQAQSWIIACEDLGNTGDYDFNDAVFKVSHVAGTNQLKVTPLAAGGTYSIEVQWNGKNISKYIGNGTYNDSNSNLDFHQLINSNASGNNGLWQQINDKSKGNAGAEITITDEDLTNFSITNHDFSVYVKKNNYASVTITQPSDKDNQAPQMLILPEYWIWPYEGRSIHLGYSGFEAWTNNQSENEDWYTKPDKTQSYGYLVDYNSFSNYPNNGEGGGNSGGNTGSDIDVSQNGFPYYINGEQQNNLPYGTSVTIPASAFGNYGGTITFQSKNNLTIGFGGNGKSHSGNPVTIDIPKSTLTDNSNLTFAFWCDATEVQKISITTNSSDTGEEEIPNIPTSIPLTVDNQQRPDLNVTTGNHGCYVEILKEYISANGATVTITATSDINAQIFKGSLSSENDYGFNNNNGTYTCELSADQVSTFTESTVKIYFWNQDGQTVNNIAYVTNISITNKQASITVKVDNETKDNLEIYNDGFQKIDIPLSYFTGNNGAEIIFTSTTVINPNSNVGSQLGGTQGDGNRNIDIMNNKLTLEARDITYRRNQGLNKIEIFLPSNSNYGITAISITNKNTNSESSEWMKYRSNDNKTATIPKSALPIGNNGINITINISGEATNIIIGQGIGIWDNGIQDYGTSITKTISSTDIDKINGDNIVIWLNSTNATITNIEISAAN